MLLEHLDDSSVVLIEASSARTVTAGAIRERAARISRMPRGLAFLMADTNVESAAWFLALVEARHPVALLDPRQSWLVTSSLVERYRPDVLIDTVGEHVRQLASTIHGHLAEPAVWLASDYGPEPHEGLAVLLTTSGSTGSPKFVRLSSANIRANAEQIVSSLDISADDRGVTALPLFYSFGMSVLTSHALAGSPVVVTTASTIEEAFWSDLVRNEVSFLPGVPTTYTMLKRLGFGRRELPRLRALTQAGGRLVPELVTYFHGLMKERGGCFFVMYGQTEASPRIACLPSERLPEKLGSVGLALPGGELSIGGPDGSHLPAREAGEVIYRGPNVMMGYADTRDDLALPATHGDRLVTGDLGYLDDEGFLYLTGRTKRICKLADSRVSLDDIESIAGKMLRGEGTVAAVDGGESGVFVFATALQGHGLVDLRHGLARSLGVPPKLIDVRAIERIPLLTSGKIDYPALKRFVDAEADTH